MNEGTPGAGSAASMAVGPESADRVFGSVQDLLGDQPAPIRLPDVQLTFSR